MPACSRCLVEVPPGTKLCPKCGAAIRSPVRQLPTPKRVGKSRQRFNALNSAERVFGPATLVLLVSFWLPWYSFGPISADGLSVHGWLFIAALDSIVLVLYVLIVAFGAGDLAAAGRMSKEQLLALITGVNLALVVLGFLLKPSGFSWSWGAFSPSPPPWWHFFPSAFRSSGLSAGAEFLLRRIPLRAVFDGGARNTENGTMANADQGEGSSTRRRILQVSLSLMSQKGVDGTSMRDLASAAGLNVASLYHYFPSKRELLEAVLVERGYFLEWDAGPKPAAGPATESALAAVLTDILVSMFEVEDFVRLMAGEAMRGEETARAVGVDLFTTFEVALAEWIVTHRPDLDERAGASAVAHLLTAMVVGIFVQYAAGVGGEEERDMTSVLTERANEIARLLGPSPA